MKSSSTQGVEEQDKISELPEPLKGGSSLALITYESSISAEKREGPKLKQVPDLETMKRAKNRGLKARVYDSEDKHESRVAKI